jgi:hypothetical protein
VSSNIRAKRVANIARIALEIKSLPPARGKVRMGVL